MSRRQRLGRRSVEAATLHLVAARLAAHPTRGPDLAVPALVPECGGRRLRFWAYWRGRQGLSRERSGGTAG
jgi:hypothetical protein